MAVLVPVGAVVAVVELPVVTVANCAVRAVFAGFVDVRVKIRVFGELLSDVEAQFLEVVIAEAPFLEPEVVPVRQHGVVLSPSGTSRAVVAAPALQVMYPCAVALAASSACHVPE